MKGVNRTRIIRNKHLLYVHSMKPYFLSAKSGKSACHACHASIGTQCEKYEHKRSVSENLEYFKSSGIANESVLRKLASRPATPVTVPINSSNYIASSKKRFEKVSKSYDFTYKASTRIIENKNSVQVASLSKISSQNMMQKRISSYKTARKVIKLTKSPVLKESVSNLSIDYYLPRYKNG